MLSSCKQVKISVFWLCLFGLLVATLLGWSEHSAGWGFNTDKKDEFGDEFKKKYFYSVEVRTENESGKSKEVATKKSYYIYNERPFDKKWIKKYFGYSIKKVKSSELTGQDFFELTGGAYYVRNSYAEGREQQIENSRRLANSLWALDETLKNEHFKKATEKDPLLTHKDAAYEELWVGVKVRPESGDVQYVMNSLGEWFSEWVNSETIVECRPYVAYYNKIDSIIVSMSVYAFSSESVSSLKRSDSLSRTQSIKRTKVNPGTLLSGFESLAKHRISQLQGKLPKHMIGYKTGQYMNDEVTESDYQILESQSAEEPELSVSESAASVPDPDPEKPIGQVSIQLPMITKGEEVPDKRLIFCNKVVALKYPESITGVNYEVEEHIKQARENLAKYAFDLGGVGRINHLFVKNKGHDDIYTCDIARDESGEVWLYSELLYKNKKGKKGKLDVNALKTEYPDLRMMHWLPSKVKARHIRDKKSSRKHRPANQPGKDKNLSEALSTSSSSGSLPVPEPERAMLTEDNNPAYEVKFGTRVMYQDDWGNNPAREVKSDQPPTDIKAEESNASSGSSLSGSTGEVANQPNISEKEEPHSQLPLADTSDEVPNQGDVSEEVSTAPTPSPLSDQNGKTPGPQVISEGPSSSLTEIRANDLYEILQEMVPPPRLNESAAPVVSAPPASDGAFNLSYFGDNPHNLFREMFNHTDGSGH